MKLSFYIRLMLIILSPIFIGVGGNGASCFAQFTGGNGDGYSLVSKTDVAVCSLPAYSTTIAAGGIADGHALVSKTDVAVCTLPAYSTTIAAGGNADGHALVSKMDVAVCSLPAYSTTIAAGGNADGHALVSKMDVAVCSLPAYSTAIAAGGNADGHALVSKTDVAICTLPTYSTTIAKGGNADGSSLLASACLSVVNLPIELLAFTAVLMADQQVLCQWETASEINNDYFTIEKTKDDSQYEFVGKVKGAGNSNITLSYQLIDADPYPGTSYYRLKQTDFNGAYTYSQLVPINLNGVDIISIFPNPARDKFEYEIGSIEKMTLQVRVMNMLGQITISETENIDKGISNRTLNVSKLSSGTYILQIITENKDIKGKQFQIK